MNKLAIIALILCISGYLSQYLLAPLLMSLGETAIHVVFYSIPIVALICGIVAFRQIQRTGQKGKFIAVLSIGVSSLYLIGIVLLLGLGTALMYGNDGSNDTAAKLGITPEELNKLQQQHAMGGR